MLKPLFKVFFNFLLAPASHRPPRCSRLLFLSAFCASSRRQYFTLTALLRYGTVIPPHPAVSSLLHNKRAPFRDYTVQDANSGVGLSLPLFVRRTTSPVNEHRSNPSSFIAQLHHKDDVFQRISEQFRGGEGRTEDRERRLDSLCAEMWDKNKSLCWFTTSWSRLTSNASIVATSLTLDLNCNRTFLELSFSCFVTSQQVQHVKYTWKPSLLSSHLRLVSFI